MSVFSGPYTTLSPPPTAGPLTIIERANENTPYASGGGGGPSTIGPNPVVSTITTNGGPVADIQPAGNTLTIGASTLSSVVITGNLISQGGFGSVVIQSQYTFNDDNDFGFFISTQNGYLPNITQAHTYFEVQSDTAVATNVNGTLDLGALPDGTAYVASYSAPGGISTLNVYADAVNMSSLNVSSINGVVPGGAVIPGDLTLSTLTMGAPGGIVGISSLQGVGSVLPVVGALNVLELTGVSSINGAAPGGGGAPPAEVSTIITLTNLSTINNGTPQLLLIAGDVGLSGGGLTASGTISTNTLAPFSGVKITLNAATIDTTAGDLAVSSINGGAYPPAAGGLQYSTIGIPGGVGTSSFVCSPGTNSLFGFSTTAGHVYSAWVLARAQSFDAAANGDQLITEILDDAVGQEAIGSWPLQSISTLSAGGSYQYIGGCVNWKAGGTGAALSVVPSQSSFVRVDAINLIDFGAI